MRILSYHKTFGNQIRMREVYVEDLDLVISTFGISFVRNAKRALMNAVEIEELADEHISLAYVESLIAGIRQGMFCVRELQQMFGIEPESGGTFLIIVDETGHGPSPGKEP